MASAWTPVPEAHNGWTPVNEAVDLRPKNVGTQADTPVAQQGMFQSLWSAVKSIADPIHDAVKSGDMGAHAADEFFRGLLDKAKEVASGDKPLHQAVLDVSGAQAAGNRMQQQVDAGNYSGAAGSALGYLVPFFAPKAWGAAKDSYNSVSDAADALNTAKGVQVAKLVARHVTKKFTGPINLASDISDVVSGDPIGVLPRRTAAAKAAPAATPAAEMSAEDLARQRNILETRRLDQTALRNQVAAELPDSAPAPVSAQGQPAVLPSGRQPGPAPAPEPIPARPQRIPLWQQLKALEEQAAPVDAPAPAAVSLPSGRIPGNTPAYDAQWEPSAPVPQAQAGPQLVPQSAPVAAPVAQVAEEAPAATADHDLELALQRSLDMVRANKPGSAATAPVVSAQNEALNSHLNATAAATAKNIEATARTLKALKIGRYLQSGGITHEDLGLFDPGHWKIAAEGAGVPAPSKSTIQMVKDLMEMTTNAQ